MAVKKKATAQPSGAAASETNAAPKAPKGTSAATPAVAETTSKADTPKGPIKTSAPKLAARKAAPVKLTERQLDLLRMIYSAKESGYPNEKKAEQKAIDALMDKKLIKKGAKDKQSGHVRYHVSKAGERHLASLNPGI